MFDRQATLVLVSTLLLAQFPWATLPVQAASEPQTDTQTDTAPLAFSTAPPAEPTAEPSPMPDLLEGETPQPLPEPLPTATPAPPSLFDEDWDMPVDFGIYTLGGWMRPDLSALNQKLGEQNFQPFARDQFSLGGGMQLGFGSLMTEFQGAINLSLPAVNSEYITSQSTGFGLFNLGFILRPTRDLRIYPLLGVGMGFVDLQFTQRNSVMDFDSFLKTPGRQGQISSFTLLLNAGLGLDYYFRFIDDFGFRLGLRGGWLWSPIQSNFWQVSNLFSNSDSNNSSLAVPGGPNVGMTGPYIQVLLGF